jgi:hypothetical protein
VLDSNSGNGLDAGAGVPQPPPLLVLLAPPPRSLPKLLDWPSLLCRGPWIKGGAGDGGSGGRTGGGVHGCRRAPGGGGRRLGFEKGEQTACAVRAVGRGGGGDA